MVSKSHFQWQIFSSSVSPFMVKLLIFGHYSQATCLPFLFCFVLQTLLRKASGTSIQIGYWLNKHRAHFTAHTQRAWQLTELRTVSISGWVIHRPTVESIMINMDCEYNSRETLSSRLNLTCSYCFGDVILILQNGIEMALTHEGQSVRG